MLSQNKCLTDAPALNKQTSTHTHAKLKMLNEISQTSLKHRGAGKKRLGVTEPKATSEVWYLEHK